MEASELRMRFTSSGSDAVKSDIRGVDSQIDTLGKSADSAKGRLGGMFSVAGGIIGAQLVGNIAGWAGGLLMASANAEQAHMSLETVTGSATKADAIFKNIQEFAKATPFSFPELVQSTISLEAFGLKSAEWLPVIGDTASAMGKSVDQVTQAVLDASSGQYERLKELGIKTQVEGDKLTFSYMKNGQMITETVDRNNQEIVTSTIASIWSDKYSGAMDLQSRSFAGQWSTIKDNVNQRLVEMSAGVFGFSTRALGFVNDIFSNGFSQTMQDTFGEITFEGVVVNIASWVFGTVADLWSWIKSKIGMSDSVMDPMLVGLMGPTQVDNGVTLWDVAVNIGSWAWGNVVDLWDWLKAQILGGPIGSGDGTGPVGAMPQFGIGSVAIDATLNLAGDLLALRDDAANWIKEAIDWTGDKTIDVGQLTINSAVELNDTSSDGDDAGKGLVQKIMDGVRNSGDEIRAANVWLVGHFFGGFGFAVGAVAGGIATAAGAIIGGLITAIRDPMAIVDAVNAFGDIIDNILAQGVDLAFETAGAAFEGFWENMKQGFELAVPVDISEAIVAPLADALNPGMWVDTAAMVAGWLWDSVAQQLVDLAPSSLGIKDKMKDILGLEDPNESVSDPKGGGGINQFVGDFDFSGLETKISDFASKFKTHVENVHTSADSSMTAAADALNAQTARMRDTGIQNVQILAQGIVQALISLPGRVSGIGSLIGYSLAQGICSSIGAVIAAATAMAAAVDIAVAARLRIASPSKVMDEHGFNTVAPFLFHLERGAGEATRLIGGMGLPRGVGGFAGGRDADSRTTIYQVIFEPGTYVGSGAMRELRDEFERGTVKIIDRRRASHRIQES